MISFDLIISSIWMPAAANILWPKKIEFKNRILSIVLMMIAFILTMSDNCSELKVVIFFPISFLILFFCFRRDLLTILLVPGTYMLGVLSNQFVNMIFALFSIDYNATRQILLLDCILTTILLVLVSLLIRKIFVFYFNTLQFTNSRKAVISTSLMLAVSTLIFLINGWQLRNLQLDLKTENWYRLLYFIQAVIIMVVFIAVTKSIQASEKAKHEDENHRNLVEYTCQIENMYEELRSFKHDYTNVLLTLSGYIDNNDMDGLRKYYQDTILPTNEKINQDKYHLHKLSRIQEPAIKGMLSAKLINAMNMGLKIFVDIVDDIPSISMGVIDLTRILGIYIDNAVEAALETESKEIKFNVVLDSNSVVIVVMNSFINKGIAINEMEKHAVSTKGEGRGIGLSNVSEILRRYPNVNKMTEMKNEYFIQTLIVENT